MEDELESIRSDIAAILERLDDLVLESLRSQLRGADSSVERRLSRARNALRRAEGILAAADLHADEAADDF